MKASDLRIGNIIMFADYDGIVYRKISAIKLNEFGLYSDIDGTNFQICKPIPLTKEWLLKIGFEFVVDTWYLNGFSLWETEWGDDKGATGIGYFYELRERGMMDKHIQYLHELQNLYYSLTGEEIL
jgi:hypothetical protein